MPYSESANPKKLFKIEYNIEAPDRETARQKAEREFFGYTMYNSASWVRVIEREGVRVWRITPDLPQTAQSIDELAQNLKSDDEDITYNTLKILGDLEDASPGSLVLPLMNHPNHDLAALAVETLGKFQDPANLSPLIRFYSDKRHPRIKACILTAIGKLSKPDDDIHHIIASALGDEDPRVRANAVELVERTRLPASTRMLVPLLEDEDNRVRGNVLKALWTTHDQTTLTRILKDMAADTNRWMRASAAFVLRHLEIDGRPELIYTLSKDPNPEVNSHAFQALFSVCDLNCLPYWIELCRGDEDLALISEKVESAGFSALEPLLMLQPKSNEERRRIRHLLDRLEQKIFQNEGWLSWLKLKQRRFFL